MIQWSRILLENPAVYRQIKKVSSCFGKWTFFTVFTSPLNLMIPLHTHPVSLRSVLMSSCHLYISLSSSLFACSFSVLNPVHISLLYTCVTHLVYVNSYISWLVYIACLWSFYLVSGFIIGCLFKIFGFNAHRGVVLLGMTHHYHFIIHFTIFSSNA